MTKSLGVSNGVEIHIENPITMVTVTVWHLVSCLMIPNSYPKFSICTDQLIKILFLPCLFFILSLNWVILSLSFYNIQKKNWHWFSLLMITSPGFTQKDAILVWSDVNVPLRANLRHPYVRGHSLAYEVSMQEVYMISIWTFSHAACFCSVVSLRRRVVSLSKTLYSPKVLVNYPGSDGSVPTWLKNCWLGR